MIGKSTRHGQRKPDKINKRDDLISILVPCYNAEKYVSQTIRSALAQTYKNIEVIAVDDGSSDATVERLKETEDTRFRWIQQDNRGAASARNRAFSECTGKFVLYLDGDDLLSKSHVAALYSALVGHSNEVAVSKWARFIGDTSEADFRDRPTYTSMSAPKWALLDWREVNMTQCGMFLLPRALVERLGGWNEALSAGPIDDFEFFARILAGCDWVRFAPDARLYYRSGIPGSLSAKKKSFESAEAKLYSLSLGVNHMLRHVNTDEEYETCANFFRHFNFDYYPFYPRLRQLARQLEQSYGGGNAEPIGPPGFHKVRSMFGWRLAKLIQLVAEKSALNGSGRSARLRGP